MLEKQSIYEETKKEEQVPYDEQEGKEMDQHQNLPKEWKFAHNHPKELILGDPSKGVTTRASTKNVYRHLVFLSQNEPKTFLDAEHDEYWILAMQEELNQFERNEA